MISYCNCIFFLYNLKSVRIDKKKKPKNDVGILRLAHPTHALRDRNPARHATGESPLQSETSLKCHLHCLGQHGKIAGYPCERAATAAFGLGVERRGSNGGGCGKGEYE